MPRSPEEITQSRFLVTLRGYDREQVHEFLGEVAQQVGDLTRANAELERALAEVRARAADAGATESAPATEVERPYAALGEETQRILEAAQETAAEITRKARQEADRQIQAARQESARAIADGERQREQAEQLVARLEEYRGQLASDLAGVGQVIDEVLGELAPAESAPTVREALSGPEELADPQADSEERPDPVQRSQPHPPVGDLAPEVASVPDADLAPEALEAELLAVADEPAQPAVELAPALALVADPDPEPAPGPDPEPAPEDPGDLVSVSGLGPEPTVEEGEDPAAALRPSISAEESESFDASPVSLRADALEPLHPKMLRRLKRGLSDLQNITLDRLRRTEGKSDEEMSFSDEELQTLADVAEPFLAHSYDAGVTSAAVLAGRSLSSPERARSLVDDFVADTGQRIEESLGASLRIGFAKDEGLSALNDRVGAVFLELKGVAADELSAVHLIRSYEFGLLDAWEQGGVSERAWVLGRELRCPEGRCRQNDEIGAADVTKAFPSGHEVPPVHVGCTCTTVPVLES